jgi:hypothetical protein
VIRKWLREIVLETERGSTKKVRSRGITGGAAARGVEDPGVGEGIDEQMRDYRE